MHCEISSIYTPEYIRSFPSDFRPASWGPWLVRACLFPMSPRAGEKERRQKVENWLGWKSEPIFSPLQLPESMPRTWHPGAANMQRMKLQLVPEEQHGSPRRNPYSQSSPSDKRFTRTCHRLTVTTGRRTQKQRTTDNSPSSNRPSLGAVWRDREARLGSAR